METKSKILVCGKCGTETVPDHKCPACGGWGPFYKSKRQRYWTNFCIGFHRWTRRCSYCHWRTSTWWYGPGHEEACDKCVPRGCSCNQYPIDGNYENIDPANWTDELDTQGRKLPCCEWMRFQEGLWAGIWSDLLYKCTGEFEFKEALKKNTLIATYLNPDRKFPFLLWWWDIIWTAARDLVFGLVLLLVLGIPWAYRRDGSTVPFWFRWQGSITILLAQIYDALVRLCTLGFCLTYVTMSACVWNAMRMLNWRKYTHKKHKDNNSNGLRTY